ncbi:MAG: alpha/beta fold hydrolase [Pararhodobacter sp.]|nr:alpha/beta fold hydrolase [Pararhodobacter sp.]
MSNPLIEARNAFTAHHREARETLNAREWGVIDTAGDGPALVLIPGTLGRADIFWQQITALSPRLRVIALTYPASGGIADWADDLCALLDTRGIDSAAVLGSSLGGYLAQYMAGAHPSRVCHLFAANTLHSVQGIHNRPPYSADLDAAPIEALRAGFMDAMQAWGQARPDQADLVEFLMGEVAGRIPEGEMRTRLNALKRGPELPPVAHEPGLLTVIDAADDPLIPPEMSKAVRARLPGATCFGFRHGGHFPYLLRPDLYSGLIAARLGLEPLASDWQGSGKELEA